MTGFWILAAALLAVVLLALLRPLLRSTGSLTDDSAASNLRILRAQLAELDGELAAARIDAEQHQVARSELERRVLEEGGEGGPGKDRAPRSGGRKSQPAAPTRSLGGALVIAAALPLSALALYAWLGNPQALDPDVQQAARENAGSAHAAPGEVEAAAAKLAARLQAEPGNGDGWALLARTYARMERFEQARDAYAKALEHGRAPDAGLLADYADALAMTQGRRITPEAEALVMKALALDPKHLKSLALAGTAAMARGDHAQAVKYWTLARDQASPDSDMAMGISAGIAEARARAGMPPEGARPAAAGAGPVGGASASSTPASPLGGALDVSVQLAPALAKQLPPDAMLIVFARAAEGPRMPLAATRLPASQLPVRVQLDDSMAMSPQMRLSAFDRVVVVARVSRTGGATAESGDLEGESQAVPATGRISLTIDRVRP